MIEPLSNRRGKFIVVEGIDGCGSTTHAKRLERALKARGERVRLTNEPTSGPIGGLIRQVLEKRLFVRDASGDPRAFAWSTMALLFAADRLDHNDSLIMPALRKGVTVISDRYDLSSLAYQSLTSERDDVVAWIRQLNKYALRPDLTLVIDVPPELAAERRGKRGGHEDLFEHDELQRQLAEVYLRAEELLPGDRVVHVSGVGSVDDVGERVLEALERELPAK